MTGPASLNWHGSKDYELVKRGDTARVRMSISVDRKAYRPSPPIFLIGCPRSGTTILGEILSRHPVLGSFVNYLAASPGLLSLSAAARVWNLPVIGAQLRGYTPQGFHRGFLSGIRRYLPKPSEAWSVWERCCGPEFRFSALRGQRPTAIQRARTTETVARVLRHQGKKRLFAKLTGPPRMSFLSEIFSDALFVHVVRDGRAVTRSLLRTDWWSQRGRDQPRWDNLLLPDGSSWSASGSPAAALTALQWQAIVRLARDEARDIGGERYLEVRYEDFLDDPAEVASVVMQWCGLGPLRGESARYLARVDVQPPVHSPSATLAPSEMELITDLIRPTLIEFGYPASAEDLSPRTSRSA